MGLFFLPKQVLGSKIAVFSQKANIMPRFKVVFNTRAKYQMSSNNSRDLTYITCLNGSYQPEFLGEVSYTDILKEGLNGSENDKSSTRLNPLTIEYHNPTQF